MKKQKVMNQLRKFTFILGFFGLMLAFPNLASAQIVKGAGGNSTTISQPPAPPTLIDPASVSWKTTAEALPLVDQVLAQLQVTKVNLAVNTLQYEQTSARSQYYTSVKANLENGVSVIESVQTSRHGNSIFYDLRSELITIMNEATSLLSN
jgi:hypothetical protein